MTFDPYHKWLGIHLGATDRRTRILELLRPEGSASMIATISTLLDSDADSAWRLVKKLSTFRHVARGILSFPPCGEEPEEWFEGQTLQSRLWFFHVLPAWRHELRVLAVDDNGREIRTAEGGGLVKKWDHTIHLEPVSSSRCQYMDILEIGGFLAPGVWLFAQAFFRYRHMRLRRLVRRMARNTTVTPR